MGLKEMDGLPIEWQDYEDIGIELYEKFGDEYTESKIYRIRFTDLIEWVLSLPHFASSKSECNEGHLEQIQIHWVQEWRENQ